MATARKQATVKATAKSTDATTTTAPENKALTFADAKIGQQISIGKINRIQFVNGGKIIHAVNDAGFVSNIEGADSDELV